MVDWFTLASQPGAAALARAAEDQLANTCPADSPFVYRLISVGLDVAAANLHTGYDLRRMS
jgi:hypothetical protein